MIKLVNFANVQQKYPQTFDTFHLIKYDLTLLTLYQIINL